MVNLNYNIPGRDKNDYNMVSNYQSSYHTNSMFTKPLSYMMMQRLFQLLSYKNTIIAN